MDSKTTEAVSYTHLDVYKRQGPCTPLALDLRDDLKSRLCWGLVYQIKSLSDEEKMAALNEQARQRGFTISPGVLPYLITHYQRDMHSLSMILDALDRYSLQTKRTITLPLLHDLLPVSYTHLSSMCVSVS